MYSTSHTTTATRKGTDFEPMKRLTDKVEHQQSRRNKKVRSVLIVLIVTGQYKGVTNDVSGDKKNDYR